MPPKQKPAGRGNRIPKCATCGKKIDRNVHDDKRLMTIGTREYHFDCGEVVWQNMQQAKNL